MVTEQTTAAPPAPALDPTTRLGYSADEVAALTGLNVKTIYAALNSGKLKGRRVTPRRWIVGRAALDAYLAGDDVGT